MWHLILESYILFALQSMIALNKLYRVRMFLSLDVADQACRSYDDTKRKTLSVFM